MKKSSLFLLSALFAAIALPKSAVAFDTTKNHRVFIANGSKRIPVGTLRCILDQFVEDSGDLGIENADACSYFCRWANLSVLRSSANLHLDELMTPGRSDCEENSVAPLETIIILSSTPRAVNKGFDKFNIKRTISALIMGEDGADGETNGIVVFVAGGASVPYGIGTAIHR